MDKGVHPKRKKKSRGSETHVMLYSNINIDPYGERSKREYNWITFAQLSNFIILKDNDEKSSPITSRTTCCLRKPTTI